MKLSILKPLPSTVHRKKPEKVEAYAILNPHSGHLTFNGKAAELLKPDREVSPYVQVLYDTSEREPTSLWLKAASEKSEYSLKLNPKPRSKYLRVSGIRILNHMGWKGNLSGSVCLPVVWDRVVGAVKLDVSQVLPVGFWQEY